MTAVQKVQKGKPLVISKKATQGQPRTVEERLVAMEADLAEIKTMLKMLKKALGE